MVHESAASPGSLFKIHNLLTPDLSNQNLHYNNIHVFLIHLKPCSKCLLQFWVTKSIWKLIISLNLDKYSDLTVGTQHKIYPSGLSLLWFIILNSKLCKLWLIFFPLEILVYFLPSFQLEEGGLLVSVFQRIFLTDE